MIHQHVCVSTAESHWASARPWPSLEMTFPRSSWKWSSRQRTDSGSGWVPEGLESFNQSNPCWGVSWPAPCLPCFSSTTPTRSGLKSPWRSMALGLLLKKPTMRLSSRMIPPTSQSGGKALAPCCEYYMWFTLFFVEIRCDGMSTVSLHSVAWVCVTRGQRQTGGGVCKCRFMPCFWRSFGINRGMCVYNRQLSMCVHKSLFSKSKNFWWYSFMAWDAGQLNSSKHWAKISEIWGVRDWAPNLLTLSSRQV